MRRSSRSAANSAIKRARQRDTRNEAKGILNAIFSGRHRVANYVHSFERSLFIQVILVGIGIASFVVLIKTYYAFQEDREFRQEERSNWRLDRIERAWNRVLRPVTGNTGKGEAINFLLSNNIDLYGLDISCKSKNVENKKLSCHIRPVITDLNIDGGTDRENFAQRIADWNVRDIVLSDISIRNVDINYWTFSGTRITDSIIYNSSLRFYKYEGVHLRNMEIVDSTIGLSQDTKIEKAVLENTVFGIGKNAIENDVDITKAISKVDAPPVCFTPVNPYIGIKPTTKACDFIKGGNVLLCGSPRDQIERNFVEKNFADNFVHREKGRLQVYGPERITDRDINSKVKMCTIVFGKFKYSYPVTYKEAKKRYPDVYK